MKNMLFLVLISTIAFSGCKFMKERSGKKGSDTLEAYVYNLEQKLAAQEQEHQVTLDQLKKESQAMIDSIIYIYENRAASGDRNSGTAASGSFYVIVGSFKTPAYASNWSTKVAEMGYQTEIVKVSHWNLVSAETSSNLRTALDELATVRSDVTVNAWVYVAR